MSFIQREVDRLRGEIVHAPDGSRRAELYAAQQALEPTGVRAPYDMVMGIQATKADCSAHNRLPQF